MTNIFYVAIVISVIYLIGRFIEMRFITKETKPLSLLFRDALLVCSSVVVGHFVLEQIRPMLSEGGGSPTVTPVFTDNPEF
jgi:cytochrome bd-type quinol oxidase subunit 2